MADPVYRESSVSLKYAIFTFKIFKEYSLLSDLPSILQELSLVNDWLVIILVSNETFAHLLLCEFR